MRPKNRVNSCTADPLPWGGNYSAYFKWEPFFLPTYTGSPLFVCLHSSCDRKPLWGRLGYFRRNAKNAKCCEAKSIREILSRILKASHSQWILPLDTKAPEITSGDPQETFLKEELDKLWFPSPLFFLINVVTLLVWKDYVKGFSKFNEGETCWVINHKINQKS